MCVFFIISLFLAILDKIQSMEENFEPNERESYFVKPKEFEPVTELFDMLEKAIIDEVLRENDD